MRHFLILIILIFATSCFAQFGEKAPKWLSTDEAWILEGYLDDVDSTETANTANFDISYIVAHYYGSDYVGGADSIGCPRRVNWTMRVDGGGTVDSLSYVYFQVVDMSGNYTTIDTLSTAKSTPIKNQVTFNNLPYWKEGRLVIAGKDLTVSGYDMKFEYQLIIPKRR